MCLRACLLTLCSPCGLRDPARLRVGSVCDSRLSRLLTHDAGNSLQWTFLPSRITTSLEINGGVWGPGISAVEFAFAIVFDIVGPDGVVLESGTACAITARAAHGLLAVGSVGDYNNYVVLVSRTMISAADRTRLSSLALPLHRDTSGRPCLQCLEQLVTHLGQHQNGDTVDSEPKMATAMHLSQYRDVLWDRACETEVVMRLHFP